MITPDGKIKMIGTPDEVSKSGKIAALKKAQREGPNETAEETDEDKVKALSEEDLLLASPLVLGFSFSDKLWLEFAVSFVHDIEFNSDAFNSLVLPENQKNIVKALVETHCRRSQTGKGEGIDDIIKGKGRGLVAVLQ